MKRHIPFLKQVALHSLTAFGGPQAHMGMMLKTFVDARKDITKEELMEYNSFCSLLPGASSTQMITLIGFKRGGLLLALLTLLIWIIPAVILMSILSFLVLSDDLNQIKFLRYINAMAISFLVYAGLLAFDTIKKNTIVYTIIFSVSLLIFFTFKLPWIFPVVIIASGLATCISKKRIPDSKVKPKKILWSNMWIFVTIFILAGFFSELSRKNNWDSSIRKPINLFENTFRMGSIVFGGGQVLIPMMESQFCERFNRKVIQERNPNAIVIDKDKFFIGAGIVRSIPGPVFSVSSFIGGLALNDGGVGRQILGCIIATLGIFLPSVLLVLFFFPIWNNLKLNPVVYRAFEGVNASVVGIMLGSCLFMLIDLLYIDNQLVISEKLPDLLVLCSCILLLKYTKLPAPVLVILVLIAGFLF